MSDSTLHYRGNIQGFEILESGTNSWGIMVLYEIVLNIKMGVFGLIADIWEPQCQQIGNEVQTRCGFSLGGLLFTFMIRGSTSSQRLGNYVPNQLQLGRRYSIFDYLCLLN